MKIEEAIGRNMRKAREDKGLSQTDLGRAVEQHLGKPWSRQAVSAAEKGRRYFTAADLMALARVLDVSVPSLFLLSDWRDGQEVELADGVGMPADEYRDRVLHELDVRGTAQLMTASDVQELGAALIKMREEYGKAGVALAGLEVDLVHAARAVKLADEMAAANILDHLQERAASEQD